MKNGPGCCRLGLLRRLGGNSNRAFVLVFHTVSYGFDGDRWRRFGIAAPASHVVPQSDKNSEGSSRKTRSLSVSAGRRIVGCRPMANGHGSTEPETTRTKPTRTEEHASRREAMMAVGLQVPSKIDEAQTKLTRKNKTQE